VHIAAASDIVKVLLENAFKFNVIIKALILLSLSFAITEDGATRAIQVSNLKAWTQARKHLYRDGREFDAKILMQV
jgi:hypothetical protein